MKKRNAKFLTACFITTALFISIVKSAELNKKEIPGNNPPIPQTVGNSQTVPQNENDELERALKQSLEDQEAAWNSETAEAIKQSLENSYEQELLDFVKKESAEEAAEAEKVRKIKEQKAKEIQEQIEQDCAIALSCLDQSQMLPLELYNTNLNEPTVIITNEKNPVPAKNINNEQPNPVPEKSITNEEKPEEKLLTITNEKNPVLETLEKSMIISDNLFREAGNFIKQLHLAVDQKYPEYYNAVNELERLGQFLDSIDAGILTGISVADLETIRWEIALQKDIIWNHEQRIQREKSEINFVSELVKEFGISQQHAGKILEKMGIYPETQESIKEIKKSTVPNPSHEQVDHYIKELNSAIEEKYSEYFHAISELEEFKQKLQTINELIEILGDEEALLKVELTTQKEGLPAKIQAYKKTIQDLESKIQGEKNKIDLVSKLVEKFQISEQEAQKFIETRNVSPNNSENISEKK
jgi:hypothetical protein